MATFKVWGHVVVPYELTIEATDEEQALDKVDRMTIRRLQDAAGALTFEGCDIIVDGAEEEETDPRQKGDDDGVEYGDPRGDD